MEEVQTGVKDSLTNCKNEELNVMLTLTNAILAASIDHRPKRNWKKFYLGLLLISVVVIWYILPYCNHPNCFLEMPPQMNHVFRPPESCDFCRDIDQIERVSNILPEQFEQKFAYSAKPVIVTDATKHWKALKVFDFYYFKELYMNATRKQKKINCQFFPYKTEFRSLTEALSMPPDRVNFETGTKPWYFGWSNCNSEVSEILRQNYDRPYFLPKLSENAATDWIFMGGSGFGAHMHVDNVRLPSWQAQIKGSKEWILAPPPECYFECNIFSTIVKSGEIIVLDTNKWFHKTNVQPGDLSITIGAEFD